MREMIPQSDPESIKPIENDEARLKQKISSIEELYDFGNSEEERMGFDEWLAQVPENSQDKPILIHDVAELVRFLPQSGNYKEERVNLFFEKIEFTPDDLQKILEQFSRNDPSFEISVTKHADGLISIGIGDKAGNRSIIFDGEYFGHYHPTSLKLKNEDALPKCFVAGLMPSAGDVKGFMKHSESVAKGTRIFSKNGYVLIKPMEGTGSQRDALKEFSEKYFDLFLGENKLGLKSDAEVKEYFKQNLGFEIVFHYRV